MKLKDYKSLIQNLPVREQNAVSKRDTWVSVEELFPELKEKFNKCYNGNKICILNREDVFMSNSLDQLIIQIIIWGYPRGGRGNNIGKIFSRYKNLKKVLRILGRM